MKPPSSDHVHERAALHGADERRAAPGERALVVGDTRIEVARRPAKLRRKANPPARAPVGLRSTARCPQPSGDRRRRPKQAGPRAAPPGCSALRPSPIESTSRLSDTPVCAAPRPPEDARDDRNASSSSGDRRPRAPAPDALLPRQLLERSAQRRSPRLAPARPPSGCRRRRRMPPRRRPERRQRRRDRIHDAGDRQPDSSAAERDGNIRKGQGRKPNPQADRLPGRPRPHARTAKCKFPTADSHTSLHGSTNNCTRKGFRLLSGALGVGRSEKLADSAIGQTCSAAIPA